MHEACKSLAQNSRRVIIINTYLALSQAITQLVIADDAMPLYVIVMVPESLGSKVIGTVY